jgi:hypothetical protein
VGDYQGVFQPMAFLILKHSDIFSKSRGVPLRSPPGAGAKARPYPELIEKIRTVKGVIKCKRRPNHWTLDKRDFGTIGSGSATS